MKTIDTGKTKQASQAGEHSREYLSFLSVVQKEVERFNESFGFEIQHSKYPVSAIDGTSDPVPKPGFVLLRTNLLLNERTYCLYSVLKGRTLYGFIGMYEDGRITTLKELRPLVHFQQGEGAFYDWMRQLVRASCEKITL
jgi:hypothetical protein